MSYYTDTVQFCDFNIAVVNLKPALKLKECVYLELMKLEINTDADEKGIMVAHTCMFASFVCLINQGRTDIYILRLPEIYCNPGLLLYQGSILS